MVQKILATCRNLHELENFQKECLIDGKHPFYSALPLTCSNFYDLNGIKISAVSSNYEIHGLCNAVFFNYSTLQTPYVTVVALRQLQIEIKKVTSSTTGNVGMKFKNT
uniref:Uncharacterized protein n=1 Tax=Glossina austeni TaxID=7395 RepID=A0A1A9VNP8_GLOAU